MLKQNYGYLLYYKAMDKRFKKIQSRWSQKKRKQLFVAVIGTLLSCLIAFNLVVYLQKRHMQQTDHKQPLIVTNLEYCNNEKLDLFVPQSSRPVPLVIYIHGGGWRYGSKVGGTLDIFTPLLKDDIAVASINYRLSDNKKYPASVEDVLCAVRFLKSQAKTFNIDAERVGLAGISAGAHLAALAANSPDEEVFTNEKYSEYSSRVEVAVLINGIFDLNDKRLTVETQENIDNFIEDNSSETLRQASPIYSLNDQSPVQLIIYSSKDKLVRPAQSKQYYQRSKQAGADFQLVEVDSADHNLNPWFRLDSRPSKKSIKEKINNFFLDQLR